MKKYFALTYMLAHTIGYSTEDMQTKKYERGLQTPLVFTAPAATQTEIDFLPTAALNVAQECIETLHTFRDENITLRRELENARQRENELFNLVATLNRTLMEKTQENAGLREMIESLTRRTQSPIFTSRVLLSPSHR